MIFNRKCILLIKTEPEENNIHIVGLYASIKDVKIALRDFNKEDSFTAYKIPLNTTLLKNNDLLEDLKPYKCHLFGTFDEVEIETDDGKILSEKEHKVTFWDIY